LLATNGEANLELLLIDPKRNAFTFAEGSTLLRRPILVPGDGTDTSEILGTLVEEMETRNQELRESNSRNLREHIERTGAPAKRTVIICDEYAALLDGASSTERRAIEEMFKRLAQVGRAPGFHLILATQQPRANIITTAIRSLLPAKIALRVSDRVESRVAIEENGAQHLLGNGDLLYKCIGMRRLQGAWLPTAEEKLVTVGTTAERCG
jgi:S-DNA-T family DNA segregation ATPase FtsK/SpoIIIE